jgi:hypothetical protein
VTPEAVRTFQATHLNHLGRALLIDGLLGPQTTWALDFDSQSPTRRSIVRVAQAFLGLTEDPVGSNTDPNGIIRNWLLNVGAKAGDPWCAAFVSHCLGTVRMGGAQALGKHFPATDVPYPGDVLWFPTVGEHGHCGIVLGSSATEVMSIEGNCGNAVRCVRRFRSSVRFARAAPGMVGICPGVVPSVDWAPGAAGATR